MTWLLDRPMAFAMASITAYSLLVLPIMASRGFDSSVFVLAGDRYVDLAAPLIVRPASDGYDGQFYYRLARNPLSRAPSVDGVRFDDGPHRMQGILYPTLAWALSLGFASLAPAALLAVNLAAIFTEYSWSAASLSRPAARLSPAPVAIATAAIAALVWLVCYAQLSRR